MDRVLFIVLLAATIFGVFADENRQAFTDNMVFPGSTSYYLLQAGFSVERMKLNQIGTKTFNGNNTGKLSYTLGNGVTANTGDLFVSTVPVPAAVWLFGQP